MLTTGFVIGLCMLSSLIFFIKSIPEMIKKVLFKSVAVFDLLATASLIMWAATTQSATMILASAIAGIGASLYARAMHNKLYTTPERVKS